ncbi:hypothetical protein LTR17_014772 [Elasticomyces elasticus]|nr:hypothetical protein LTR17_014772 [Elasticomyces elasticus]
MAILPQSKKKRLSKKNMLFQNRTLLLPFSGSGTHQAPQGDMDVSEEARTKIAHRSLISTDSPSRKTGTAPLNNMLSRLPARARYAAAALLLICLVYLTSTLTNAKDYIPEFLPSKVLGEHKNNDGTSVEDVSWAGREVRIALTETGGSHDEVVGALINAFGSLKNVRFELYQEWQRYKSEEIFNDFTLTNELPDAVKPDRLMAEGTNATVPDILISTSCELDTVKLTAQFEQLLAKGKTYMFCFIHHADHWNGSDRQKIMMPWARAGMVDFVTLSEHTALYLREHAVPSWDLPEGTNVTIRTLPPIFPVKSAEAVITEPEAELGFALQGNYEPSRRDYQDIFKHLGAFLAAAKERVLETYQDQPETNVSETASNIMLHLIGHGDRPKVMEHLGRHVVFDADVDYPDFYAILSRTFALLPAFASDTYYDRKASSTVPASLIAGVPLVATRQLLKTYTYVKEEDVWLQEDGEQDFDIIGRILAMTTEQRAAKKAKVRATRDELIRQNKLDVKGWMETALRRTSSQSVGMKSGLEWHA